MLIKAIMVQKLDPRLYGFASAKIDVRIFDGKSNSLKLFLLALVHLEITKQSNYSVFDYWNEKCMLTRHTVV